MAAAEPGAFRLRSLLRHLRPQGTRSPGLSVVCAAAAPAGRRHPQFEVFVNLCSVESYVSLGAVVQALQGYKLRWRSARARAKMSVAVGMMRERADPARQSYQLNILKTYAQMQGLPLAVPRGDIDTAAAEAAVAYLAEQESGETVAPQFLRLCFAAIFDPVCRRPLDDEVVQQLISEAGGDARGFSEWPEADRAAALEADREAAAARGVWTTPFVVDADTEEAFIGEETLKLAALRPRRRGCSPVPGSLEMPAPAAVMLAPREAAAERARLEVYVDVKSPYAFLAIEPTYALEEDFQVDLVWRPLLLDIQSYLGSAEVGAKDNKVKEGSNKRSPGQWRAVKYAYMNVRRYAAERKPPLTVYGTRKIWNTTLAGTAMLYADDGGTLREFQQRLWPPFWRRELDVEDLGVIEAVLQSSGIATDGFEAFARGEGLQRLTAIQEEARRRGVFGVPTYVLNGELFFGREHLPLLRRRLCDAGHAKREAPEVLASPYLWTRNDLFAGF